MVNHTFQGLTHSILSAPRRDFETAGSQIILNAPYSATSLRNLKYEEISDQAVSHTY